MHIYAKIQTELTYCQLIIRLSSGNFMDTMPIKGLINLPYPKC